MKVKIQSIHFDADQKLLDYVNDKIEKLLHFDASITDSEVYLKLEKSNQHANKVTEIRIHIPGKTLFAEEHRKSFEEAFDISIEALIAQLKKHKEKLREK